MSGTLTFSIIVVNITSILLSLYFVFIKYKDSNTEDEEIRDLIIKDFVIRAFATSAISSIVVFVINSLRG